MTPPLLSVIVPTLDEEKVLPRLLADLAELEVPREILVVDGGSRDGTLRAAWEGGARVVDSVRSRGTQLRVGAGASRGEWLFFVHADTRVPPEARAALRDFLDRALSPHGAAYFRFSLDGSGWFWRFIEVGQRIRERLGGLVYGDQGLLVSRSAYKQAGGHPHWPVMEDVGLVDALRRRGRLHRLEATLPTSPRRYAEEGRWRAWLRNAALITRFRLGTPPETLARRYAPRRAPEEVAGSDRRSLVVFAKAPRPGSVKTRLAADVGDEAAARIYRHLGRQVVDAVRGGAYRTVVCHAPADAGAEAAEWLGREGVAYRAQAEGDLGARMAEAFEHAFTGADRVCIVGTDAPGVDEALVSEAFDALAQGANVVVGPAADGGYYLLGLDRPTPDLFRDMPWSTSRVFGLTVERARNAGLETVTLPVLTDVDTLDDVPERLLAP